MENQANRREGETVSQFELFEAYRRLPPFRRSVQNLMETLGQESPSRSYLVRLMTEQEWEERAVAYDREAEAMRLAEEREAAREMNERHIHFAKRLEEKAITAIEAVDPLSLGAQEARQYLEAGVKIERTARGEPESVVEQRVVQSQEEKALFFDRLRDVVREMLSENEES